MGKTAYKKAVISAILFIITFAVIIVGSALIFSYMVSHSDVSLPDKAKSAVSGQAVSGANAHGDTMDK